MTRMGIVSGVAAAAFALGGVACAARAVDVGDTVPIRFVCEGQKIIEAQMDTFEKLGGEAANEQLTNDVADGKCMVLPGPMAAKVLNAGRVGKSFSQGGQKYRPIAIRVDDQLWSVTFEEDNEA